MIIRKIKEFFDEIYIRYENIVVHRNDELYKRKIKKIRAKIKQYYLDCGLDESVADYESARLVKESIKQNQISKLYTKHKEFLKA